MNKYVMPGGATRSEKAPRMDLIPPVALEVLAQRFAEGEAIHGPWQWLESLDTFEHATEFCREALNHVYAHLGRMQREGTKLDDHIGAIGWAVCALAYARDLYGDVVLPTQPVLKHEGKEGTLPWDGSHSE
tara:strand:- start:1318 stop:1710 length:393 start_codon:yes stop_codon:yes gene_type:complete